jgi:Na+/H+ antiporter NhaD/arsenite permease-like protein
MTEPHGAALAASYDLPWAIPFIGLLLTIALAPLLAPKLWHVHYGKLASLWAAAFLAPAAIQGGPAPLFDSVLAVALHEYLPFVLLLGTLFTVAGGLRITGTPRGTPGVNTTLLAIGTMIASMIGTTGAAMVMLRPLIRANRHRRHTAHVFVFFIFLVANVGGALTPLGDPPLFLGFLRGVPFLWPTVHLALPTLTLAGGLLAVFYAFDHYVHRRGPVEEPDVLPEIEKLGVEGGINLALLAATVGSVLLRGVWQGSPVIDVLGVPWELTDIVADALLVLIGVLSLVLTRPAVRAANEFEWGPMAEVAILFAAIFITLMPLSAMIGQGASGPAAPLVAGLFDGAVPNDRVFYWLTGALSAFLDNAPTYLVFFGFAGGDAAQLTGPLASTLVAISAGAVYFGAMTYIGNAPNFMVKSIVESHGIRMPSFLGYLVWAAICLLPWLLAIDAIFFR